MAEIRSRKELIYLNSKDITPEELEKLGDLELNICDNCGEIDSTYRLEWIDSEEFWNDEACVSLVAGGFCALCDDCYDKRNTKLAQCGSCDKYFIAYKDDNVKFEKPKNLPTVKEVLDKLDKGEVVTLEGGKHTVKPDICPHCFSGNWAYGCIDEPEPNPDK